MNVLDLVATFNKIGSVAENKKESYGHMLNETASIEVLDIFTADMGSQFVL